MSEAKKESFDKEFQTLRELGEAVFVLRGSTIIVEILPDEELKIKGTDLVIASSLNQVKGNSVEQHKLQVGKVLMTGPGYFMEKDEEGKDVYDPLDIKPGAIVVLPKYSVDTISTFPGISRPTGNRLGTVRMDSIIAYYPSEAAYQTARAKLN